MESFEPTAVDVLTSAMSEPNHARKLVIGGIALTGARVRRDRLSIMAEVMNGIEAVLNEVEFFGGQPFRWLNIVVRYGLIDAEHACIDEINEQDGELGTAIEVDVRRMMGPDRPSFKRVIREAASRTVLDVASAYGIETRHLAERLERIGA